MALGRSQRIGQVGIGTPQVPWSRLNVALSTFNGTLDALGLYSHLVALPATDPANGRYLLGPFDVNNLVALKFHGTHGTDANDKTGTFRVWLLSEMNAPWLGDGPVEYLGDPVIDGNLVIGNTTINTSSKIITGASGSRHKWVDTINITSDYTRDGVVKIGAAADGAATIGFDKIGAPYVLVQLELGDATGLGVCFREV